MRIGLRSLIRIRLGISERHFYAFVNRDPCVALLCTHRADAHGVEFPLFNDDYSVHYSIIIGTLKSITAPADNSVEMGQIIVVLYFVVHSMDAI